MQALALIVVVAAGLWLGGVALLMALRPRYCLHLLKKMTTNLQQSNWRLQYIEQGLRILVGVALVVRAPVSKLPLPFAIFGWILIVSSTVILIAPIRWHGAYGTWLVEWFNPLIIRLLSPFPALFGAGLIYAAVGA